MSNVVAEIYAGWKNYAFKNPYIEKIAKDRLDICVACVDGLDCREYNNIKPN